MAGDRNGLMRKMEGGGRRDSLVALADSINETGRMARANVSLTLIGALYLALTLLSAKDENLLRNAVVSLPQLGTGISLELSYIFGPVVFLYLHVQTLFLLAVLARKVGTYEKSLARMSGVGDEVRAEYRDRLSAVSLVQAIQGGRTLAAIARILMWIGAIGVPLLLLFLIDTSFLRYQSFGTTLFHHACFTADLACVWWFRLTVFQGHSRMFPERRETPTAAFTAIVTIIKLTAKPCSVVLVAVLWLFAWPKPYHGEFNEGPPAEQSQPNETDRPATGPRHRLPSTLQSKQPRSMNLSFNVFDDLLCGDWLWRGFCRRLEVRGATLIRWDFDGEPEGLFGGFDGKRTESYRRLYGLDLTGRSLRHADLSNAYLLAANLSGADLRGATLQNAELHGADLSRAELENAVLTEAELVGADLTGIRWIIGATLSKTLVVGTEGHPKTDGDTVISGVRWKTMDLPQPGTCSHDSDDAVRCHLELREIPLDLPLARNPEVTLLEHLLKFAEGDQCPPEWLPPEGMANNPPSESCT